MEPNSWLSTHPFFKFNPADSLKKFFDGYESPVYLYSKKVIEHQYNLLRKNLPQYFEIFYAQKSNPNPEILKKITSLGAGCDTASEGEIQSALDAGFGSEKIMFTGPGKSKQELEFAIDKKLFTINVESLQELELINEIASEKNSVQDILVRINPEFEAGETNRIIGGIGPSKFGVDIEQIPEFISISKKKKNIRLRGIHIFNSSQILNWERILENTKNVISTARDLEEEHDLNFDVIDLGGGFGIPYSEEEQWLDVEKLGCEVEKMIGNKFKEFIKGKKLIFEPGRFLTGPCGIYLMKVLYTKKSSGKNMAITDGGIHHLIRPALIGQKHPIINFTAIFEEREKKYFYTVAGPLCTYLDQFDEYAFLNEIRPGDILGILNAGAYGYTESMPYFLSHRKAEEIFLDD